MRALLIIMLCLLCACEKQTTITNDSATKAVSVFYKIHHSNRITILNANHISYIMHVPKEDRSITIIYLQNDKQIVLEGDGKGFLNAFESSVKPIVCIDKKR